MDTREKFVHFVAVFSNDFEIIRKSLKIPKSVFTKKFQDHPPVEERVDDAAYEFVAYKSKVGKKPYWLK